MTRQERETLARGILDGLDGIDGLTRDERRQVARTLLEVSKRPGDSPRDRAYRVILAALVEELERL